MSRMPEPLSRSPRVAVVGGGILGVAVARRIQQVLDPASVVVLEKEDRLAAHQTGRNSGVVHAGLYYEPGSLKATLCRRGVGLLRELCEAKGLPYNEIGKVLVALDDTELARLDGIEARARANGVPGIARLTGAQLREIEPHVAGVGGLHSPTTAITDYAAVTRALADDVVAGGGEVQLRTEVTGVSRRGAEVLLTTGTGTAAYDLVVLCAGARSDRLGLLATGHRAPAIVPFAGEYHLLAPERRDLVRGLIYPVPDPRYPFLGVHLTPRVDGSVLVGPNAVLAPGREAYRRRDASARELLDVLRTPGFTAFARQHWRTGVREVAGSVSRRRFAAAAAHYVPGITAADLRPGPTGIRAQALDPDGSLVDDFRIERVGGVVSVRNAPSPGATSSLAIAEHLVDGLR